MLKVPSHVEGAGHKLPLPNRVNYVVLLGRAPEEPQFHENPNKSRLAREDIHVIGPLIGRSINPGPDSSLVDFSQNQAVWMLMEYYGLRFRP